jgi:hypothetical protein
MGACVPFAFLAHQIDMRNHTGFSLGLFVFILGLALLFIAAAIPWAPVEPFRLRVMAAGLFCVWLSTALS